MPNCSQKTIGQRVLAHCEAIAALDLPCDTIIAGSLQEAVASMCYPNETHN